MKKSRAIVALLLTIALPYSAIASIVDGLRCHHEGIGALADGGGPAHHDHAGMLHHDGNARIHHDHAAMMPAHHADATAADGAPCAGPVKCHCAHHCAGSGGNAALTLKPFEMATVGRVALMTSTYAALIADAQPSPAFRPPIAASPSAA